jgi:hypothetical protein
MNDLGDLDDDVRASRTAILPRVAMPTWAADVAGSVLVLGAVINVAAGAIRALSFRLPIPDSGLGQGFVLQPHLTVFDRLQLLINSANGFSAVLVLLGAVFLVIARQSDDGRERWRATGLAAAAGVAAVVLVANAAFGVAIFDNARGTFTAQAFDDRLASCVALLAPIAIAVGVLFYIAISFTSEPDHLPGTGPAAS